MDNKIGKEFLEYLKHHVKCDAILTRPDGKKFMYIANKQTIIPVEETEDEIIVPIEEYKDEFDEWFEQL